MRKVILIVFVLASAFLVFRPAETIGAEKHSRQQVNLSETVTYPDTDGDGCNDAEEIGPSMLYGGQRNPANPYDFYDIVGHDGIITVSDTQDLAFRWGAHVGDPLYKADRDRSWTSTGLGPPDGVIDVTDLQASWSQFGDTCHGPLTFTLADISADCDGNFREASGVGAETVQALPEDGKTLKDCLLVRDKTGRIVDVIYEETTAEKGATAASSCVGCIPGSEPAAWYQTSKSVKKELKWPPNWLRCSPGLGFLPQVCAPQIVTAGLYMNCSWKYLVSSNVYNGAVVPVSCNDWIATNYPWRLNTLYDIQTRWVVTGFQQSVSDRALFEYAPVGKFGTLQQLMLQVGIVYGPWGNATSWTQ